MWSFFSRDVVKDFGYEIGTPVEVDSDLTFWKLHGGKKKSTGEAVSIFSFEVTTPDTQAFLDIAKASVKRLKTLRHPSILTYADSLETDKLVYVVTEKIEPLSLHLSQNGYSENQKKLAISWGLYQIASGISFLNKDCNLSHNNICFPSVFVDRAGEWKLFGFEYVVPNNERPPSKYLTLLKRYNPPESDNPSSTKSHPWSWDSWGYGCLIWESFNGFLLKASSLKVPGNIPQNLVQCFGELTSSNPASRPSLGHFLKKASKGNGFFKNKFVLAMLFLREIHIKDNEEKTRFFNDLSSSLDNFPQDICLYKVLPELINAFEFGSAGSSILSPMFKLGKLLSDEEYQQKIVPCIVKMFSSKDRTTRAKLLQRMDEFIDHFNPTIINAQIFPNVAQGFLDTSPVIREYTIKCMFNLAPKLNYQNLNEEMLKHFARLQTKDDQGGIRTNTTVCLGKIAPYLHPQTRKKVLINAFIRALRDPFPPARTAAILAFCGTSRYYTIHDCATRVLPALCVFTIDADKGVRDQAFKAISGYLQKLSEVSEDPSIVGCIEKDVQSTTPSASSTSWTSWAVTSLVDKLQISSLTKSATSPAISNVKPTVEKSQEIAADKAPDTILDKNAESPALPSPAKTEETAEEISDVDDWNTDWNDEEENLDNEKSTKMSLKVENTNAGSEWDVDDWESFETVATFQQPEDNRLQDYFTKDTGPDPFSSSKRQSSASPSRDGEGWDVENDWNSGWGNDDSTNEGAISPKSASRQEKLNEGRLARQEMRKQKMKERQMAKPKKLGAQKIS